MPSPVEAHRDSDRLDPLIWKIGSVVVLGSFLSQLDATVVNVSLSSLAVTFHSSLSAIHWVTSGYLLALALMLPLSDLTFRSINRLPIVVPADPSIAT